MVSLQKRTSVKKFEGIARELIALRIANESRMAVMPIWVSAFTLVSNWIEGRHRAGSRDRYVEYRPLAYDDAIDQTVLMPPASR
jgi:hypothetical protein